MRWRVRWDRNTFEGVQEEIVKCTGEFKGVKWEGDVKQTSVWLCFFVKRDKTLSEEDSVAFFVLFCSFPSC